MNDIVVTSHIQVTRIPVTVSLYKDPSCGGHSGPYFLFTGEVSLTSNGSGWMAKVAGTASDKEGNETSIQMEGPLNSKGKWVTTHPWGCLGFLPIQLGTPYPPQLGWHEVSCACDAQYVKHFALPTQVQLDRAEIKGTIS